MLVVVIVLLARFCQPGVVQAFFSNRIEAGSVSGGWLDHATARPPASW